MKTEVRDISPEIAENMLKLNGSNRKISESHVNFLAGQMTGGEWMFDGQPIRMNGNGSLLDGQHRLSAVIKSGTTQKFLVVSGIEHDAFRVMDTGKNRSAADVFFVEEIPNAASCAAVCRAILSIKAGFKRDASHKTDKTSNLKALEFYKTDSKNIDRIVSQARQLNKVFDKVLPGQTIGSLYYCMAEKNVVLAEEFWNKLCSGIGLEDGSPILLLRKKLISDKISNRSLSKLIKHHFIIKCWVYYRKGLTLRTLKISEDEKFPEII